MKHKLHLLLSCFCLAAAGSAMGQAIDNTAIYRTVQSERYFRLHYENDFFTAKDQYYTQGINLEIVLPVFRHLPISKFLIKPKNSELIYGFSLEHNAYTPTSIRHTEIIEGDRPFAACLFGKFFIVGNDTIKQRRVSSSLSLGVIGSDAGGRQMQETIHRWLNNIQPLGWNHQVKNDFIINYEANIDKALIVYNKSFLLAYNVGGRVGTLSDKASAGFMFMAGHLDNPFKAFNVQKSNYQVYVYAQPQVSVIGYDATLQGGLFNTGSPYTISDGNIERITSQTNFGIVFKLKALQLEYFRSYITKEFKTGDEHFWGGIRIATRF